MAESGVGRAIRAARPADVPRIRALVEAAYAPYVERIGRRPAPMDADYPALVGAGSVWVAGTGDDVTGVMVLEQHPDHLLVDDLAVAPTAQGTGLGSALLDFARDRARTAGLGEIRLFTNQAMTENLEWYPRRGFVETRRATSDGYARVYFAAQVDRPADG